MGFMFALPFIMIPLVFMFVIGMFIYTFSQTIKEKKKNDNSPRLTVNSRIVDKRSDMHRHRHDDHHHDRHRRQRHRCQSQPARDHQHTRD